MPDEELGREDIALLALLCAVGLPGAESLDIPGYLRKLDDWVEQVRVATRRMWYRFERDPAEFRSSPGYFRILVMVTVLQRDLGVKYNPDRMAEQEADDVEFFRDPRDLFIHGLLNGHGGTCASMPVLYVAVGRRLGYPLRLVLAKGHPFVRWHEPGGEQFNIEATNRGLNVHPDEHYRRWPFPITDTEMEKGLFLRNLSPREELALLVETRGNCLFANLRLVEALEAYHHAEQLAPRDPNYRSHSAVTTMLYNEVAGNVGYGLSDPIPAGQVAEGARLRPIQQWEKNCLPHARKVWRHFEPLRRRRVEAIRTLCELTGATSVRVYFPTKQDWEPAQKELLPQRSESQPSACDAVYEQLGADGLSKQFPGDEGPINER